MLLKLSVLINILLICTGLFLVVKRYRFQQGLHVKPSTYNEDYNKARSYIFKTCGVDTGDVVMIGTSLTEGFPLEVFKQCNIKNRGIGGNNLAQIRGRLNDIVASKPARLFLEGGTNDILHDSSSIYIENTYEHMMQQITPIADRCYIISIPPLDSNFAAKNIRIDGINYSVKKSCRLHGIKYIDIASSLKDNRGYLKYTYDGIHLTMAGYEVWKNALSPYIIDSHIPFPR